MAAVTLHMKVIRSTCELISERNAFSLNPCDINGNTFICSHLNMIKELYRGHFGGQGLLFYDRTNARYTLKYMIIIFVK